MSSREALRRISSIMLEVEKPVQKLSLRSKLIWTGIVVIVYLVMTQIPLYGVAAPGGDDPFGLFGRVIFASSRGTLMELGIGPIVTAGIILQLLKGAEIVKFDFTKPEERALFTTATKFLTIVLAVVQAASFVAVGVLQIQDPTVGTLSVVFLQLIVATIIVMMLDEMVQKGWGLGSGISLFIAVGVAENIFWSTFSPVVVSEGGEPFGIIPYALWSALTGGELVEGFFRPGGLPTFVGLMATVIIAVLIIYAEGIRIELPVSYARYRGFRGRYPVKLLYVSVIPVILASALIQNLFLFSQLVWRNWNSDNANPLLNLFGTYDAAGSPTGGLAYLVTAPNTLSQTLADPFKAVSFVAIMVILSMLFSMIWVEIGGLSAETVSQQIIDAGMQVPGFRRRKSSLSVLLGKYIPIVTVLGGLAIGLIAGGAQIFGVFGSGTGILLTVGIMMNYYQLLMREQVEEIYPAVTRVL
ncbi:MAG: preprotein translocase subunit SecY [Candidatus Geothermarchaeales archaeon]